MYEEARTFLEPEEFELLKAAHHRGRISARLEDETDGLARYARMEALCARGFLAYDGDDGLDDELVVGFVITDAGRARVTEARP